MGKVKVVLVSLTVICFSLHAWAQNDLWESTNTPQGNSQAAFQDIIFDAQANLFAVRVLDIYRSENFGNSWEIVNNGLTVGGFVSVAGDNSGRLWLGTNAGVYQSGDEGQTWWTTGLMSGVILETSVIDDNLYAGIQGAPLAGGGIAISSNHGVGWNMMDSGLPPNLSEYRSIVSDDAGVLYLGTNGGVFRLSDNSQQWTSTGLENVTTRSIIVTATGDLIAGTREAGVFRLPRETDGWITTNGGLTNTAIIDMTSHANGDIFAATLGGIFRLASGEDNWQSLGLTQLAFHALAISSDGILFAGADDDIFRSKEPIITSVNQPAEGLARTLHLHQNFPNPFNPETRIKYDVPIASQIKLEILNILGQRIKTLVDEVKAPGTYEVVWNGFDEDGTASASGVYLYRMTANGFATFKRLLLIR